MHEMAIAEGILDIALDYAKQNNAQKVNEVGLLLGEERPTDHRHSAADTLDC